MGFLQNLSGSLELGLPEFIVKFLAANPHFSKFLMVEAFKINIFLLETFHSVNR